MSREHRRMDRFIVIPFSSGCRSHSSVDVVDTRHKKPHGDGGGGGGGEGKQKGDSLMARLLRGFKTLSQIFAVYEEDEDGEEEREMIIGYPTDVKHVAHIGWDGSTNTTQSVRTWNRSAPPPEAPPAAAPNAPPQPSVRQLELAMAAQAAGASTSSTSTTGHCYSVAG